MHIILINKVQMFDPEETIDEYTVTKKLGEGYSADVYEVRLNGKYFAIKLFKLSTSSYAESEYNNVSKVYHPNIIEYLQYRREAKHISKDGQWVRQALIMEYACNKDIYWLVDQCRGLTEIMARTYFHMLIQAMEYIHDCGVAHLDIKPQNLLLDEFYRLKIADFGISSKHGHFECRRVGTEGYMSPEIEDDEEFCGYEADLYAAGVVLFIMRTHFHPFKRAKPSDQYYSMLEESPARYWNVFSALHLSAEFKDLIEKMLAEEPTERLTVEQIKQHPWYCGDILLKEELSKAVIDLLVKSYAQ